MFNQLKWWIVILLAGILIIYLIPKNLSVRINEKLNRYAVEKIARTYLHDNGYTTNDYHVSVTGNQANYITSYLNSKVEQEKFDQLVNSNLVPNIRWQINFVKTSEGPTTNQLSCLDIPAGCYTGF